MPPLAFSAKIYEVRPRWADSEIIPYVQLYSTRRDAPYVTLHSVERLQQSPTIRNWVLRQRMFLEQLSSWRLIWRRKWNICMIRFMMNLTSSLLRPPRNQKRLRWMLPLLVWISAMGEDRCNILTWKSSPLIVFCWKCFVRTGIFWRGEGEFPIFERLYFRIVHFLMKCGIYIYYCNCFGAIRNLTFYFLWEIRMIFFILIAECFIK